MRPTRRFLTGVAGVLAAALTASACGASPYAAVVNSQVISQSALNRELRTLAGNRLYVQAFDQQAASSQIQVQGDAAGTYSNSWVSYVLSQIIEAAAVHQALAASGALPDQATYDAARSVDRAKYGAAWFQFPASYRDTLVQRDAELAALEPVSTDVQTLLGLYQANRKYFFTRVCTRQVDTTGTLAQARAVAAQMNQPSGSAGTGGNSPQAPGGSVTCYSAAGLDDQPAGFVNTVMALAPGQATPPSKTPYGYRIVAVVSRDEQPFGPEVQRALSAVVALSNGTPEKALNAVLAKARIKVNPAYGAWKPGSNTTGAGVQPPVVPLSGPATTQG